jgi:hypothetical protein
MPCGSTFYQNLLPGIECETSQTGILMHDPEGYNLYRSFLDKVVEDLHPGYAADAT